MSMEFDSRYKEGKEGDRQVIDQVGSVRLGNIFSSSISPGE
jgi:hypothetical protein